MTSLKAGDIVWVDFDPVRGSEQGGVRPAIILTSAAFHDKSAKAIVCPITSNPAPWPTKVALPAGLKTKGYVLADQVRTLHRSERGFRFVEETPSHVLEDIRAIVGQLIGIGRA